MQKNTSYKTKIEHPFLLIPVKIKENAERLSFYMEEQKVLEYRVFPLEEGETVDYYAPLPVTPWIGKTIRLEGNYPEAFYTQIKQADDPTESDQVLPLMHFTPVNGWMNDPNGLVFEDGIYHLFYQHNAFGTKWDNMSWGHAVSKDLLHWEHRPMAILPDKDGTIFSGSGICNEKGLLGLPKDALVFFYTSAGGSSDSPWSEGGQFTQRIAYSTDHGATLHKKGDVIVPNLTEGNRDPKVYWHEESKGYIMSLYLKNHVYAILRSEDLEHWELTQKLPFITARECPDLRPVPTEEGGEKWILFTASGEYFTGDFDGFHFTNLSEGRMAYQNELPYAGQTYSNLQGACRPGALDTHRKPREILYRDDGHSARAYTCKGRGRIHSSSVGDPGMEGATRSCPGREGTETMGGRGCKGCCTGAAVEHTGSLGPFRNDLWAEDLLSA